MRTRDVSETTPKAVSERASRPVREIKEAKSFQKLLDEKSSKGSEPPRQGSASRSFAEVSDEGAKRDEVKGKVKRHAPRLKSADEETSQAAQWMQDGVRQVAGSQDASLKEGRRLNVDDVLPKDVLDRIVEDVRLVIKGKEGKELQFDLKPEVFGGLKLKVGIDEGKISISFIARSEEVKELIGASSANLMKALEDRGLEVTNMSVTVDSQAASSQRGGAFAFAESKMQGSAQPEEKAKVEAKKSASVRPQRRSRTDYTV